MAALRRMVTNLMLGRAIAASWPALKAKATTPDGFAVLEEASKQEFARRVVDHYGKQMRVARVAGIGLAGVTAVTLAGFGIYRLNKSTETERDV